jgi:hypothetical protein
VRRQGCQLAAQAAKKVAQKATNLKRCHPRLLNRPRCVLRRTSAQCVAAKAASAKAWDKKLARDLADVERSCEPWMSGPRRATRAATQQEGSMSAAQLCAGRARNQAGCLGVAAARGDDGD